MALCIFKLRDSFPFFPPLSVVCERVHTCMHAHFVLLVLLGRCMLFCTSCTFYASNLNIKSNISVGQLHAVINLIAVNRRPKCVHGYLWNYWDPVHHCAGDRPGYLGVVCIQEPSYIFRPVTHQGESTLWPCLYESSSLKHSHWVKFHFSGDGMQCNYLIWSSCVVKKYAFCAYMINVCLLCWEYNILAFLNRVTTYPSQKGTFSSYRP